MLGVCRLILLIAAISFFNVTAAKLAGSEFTIDPAQSYLTLSGTAPSINGPVPITAQAAGSLTDFLSGSLFVNMQVPGQLQIDGSSINGIAHPGPYQPFGLPADFAGQSPNVFLPGGTGNFIIQQSFDYATSSVLPVNTSGAFNASGVNLRLESAYTEASAAPQQSFSTQVDLEMSNLAVAPASITTVGDQYRIAIPFQGSATANIGVSVNLGVSGQLVAMRPIAGSSTPDILDGGFENHYAGPVGGTVSGPTAWSQVIPGTPFNVAGFPIYPFTGQRPMAAEGLQTAFLNVLNGTASIYQTIIPGGSLQPHTIYQVKFDVGNRDLTDNGNLPNNDMDPFISVKGFFTLGNDLADFSKHIGSPYSLAQLSTIPDGTWTYGNTVLLDTSLLTPEQLTEPLNFVLQATSTTTLNRGQVNFDDVRLTIVPEPSTFALAGLSFAGLAAWYLRGRNRLARHNRA